MYNRLTKNNLKARTVTLKVKYSDFKTITRSQSFPTPTRDLETISAIAKKLMAATFVDGQKIRLLGVSTSNFGEIPVRHKSDGMPGQLELFEE